MLQLVVDRTSLLLNLTKTEPSEMLLNQTKRTEPKKLNQTIKSYFLQLTARSLETSLKSLSAQKRSLILLKSVVVNLKRKYSPRYNGYKAEYQFFLNCKVR